MLSVKAEERREQVRRVERGRCRVGRDRLLVFLFRARFCATRCKFEFVVIRFGLSASVVLTCLATLLY